MLEKLERKTVNVKDIAEFPTALGSRCALLYQLGFDAYINSEEELLEVLTESAKHPEQLQLCLRDSRCRAFWEGFKAGRTPYADLDPIRLKEYGGRYWAVEGKHRVCLAKRAGIETIEAMVRHLRGDSMTLLSPEGQPGRFSFRATFTASLGRLKRVEGSVGFLWVEQPNFCEDEPFTRAWLDASLDTRGKWVDVLPGVRYRIAIGRKHKGWLYWPWKQKSVMESEVEIRPDHAKAKIWLLQVPVADVFKAAPLPFVTLYRYGCWRRHHFEELRHVNHPRHKAGGLRQT